MVFRRNSRSWRKRPLCTSSGRFALVAEITRTSTLLGFGRADALHFADLEHAQKLGLQIHRHIGDFVEEQRAACRPARSVLRGPSWHR